METKEFWSAIWIFVHNFHAVNRKLFACLIEEIFLIPKGINKFSNASNVADFDFADCANDSCDEAELKRILATEASGIEGAVIKQKLLTKKFQQNINEVSIIDFTNKSLSCHFLASDLDDFRIKYENGDIVLEALTKRNVKESSERWLQYVVKPKLNNWAKSSLVEKAANVPTIKSLQLIDIEAYNDLYKQLKVKYAEELKQLWLAADESTDPLKFIYEDLAIAAYLICLWQAENDVIFADLGCGNGLLVHVLKAEGFAGYGYDLRRRKLWSLYADETQKCLLEAAIVPDDGAAFSLPHNVNWLIGNHSDELSAWLPVLAALKSYEASYFLLPCCAFEFSGSKFQRRNAKLSTYQDFFAYARSISNTCGFETLADRLKIPSTKRLALVGRKRKHSPSEYERKCVEIKEFFSNEMQSFPHTAVQAGNVKLRETAEPVRNCTKIDSNIINALVLKIFHLLLNSSAATNYTPVENISWQSGGQLTLQEIVKHLNPNELKQLKAECGGVKTLLRNKHEVFEFHANGCIALRKPQQRESYRKGNNNIKRRNCFFHENHPDGCPLSKFDCSFLHADNCCIFSAARV